MAKSAELDAWGYTWRLALLLVGLWLFYGLIAGLANYLKAVSYGGQ